MPLWRAAGAEVLAWDLDDFDVRDGDAVRRVLRDARPDLVLHLAAYTAVDRAEAEPAAALAVNRDGTANVARACRETGARLVYLSTDYVFDGHARAPLPPAAPRAPHGAYALSKAAGEAAVETSGCRWAVVRTAWVFGPGGPNFVDTVRRAAAEGRALTVVNDQHGAPTSTRLVSEGLWGLERAGRLEGTWHLAAAGDTTWYQVARTVYATVGADPGLVSPCATAQSGRAAPRPAYAVLDCAATVAALGVPLPHWRDQVVPYVHAGRAPGIGLLGEAH